jgi:hypothetical protein
MTDGVNIKWPDMMQGCTVSRYLNESVVSILRVTDGPFGRWQSASRSNHTCPTSWGIYGNWYGEKAISLNIVQCWSAVQETQASVHFSLPDWEIRSLSVNESTTKYLYSGLETQLDLSEVFPLTSSLTNRTVFEITNFNGVFSRFLRSQTSNNLHIRLTERENFDDLYARIQEVYGIIIARTFDVQGRNNTPPSETLLFNATATEHNIRLVQNAVSTCILHGLLACMIICGCISVYKLCLSNVLPKNPCSIAAQASFVAGSKMLASLPPEAQWMDDGEFKALFENKRYLMGWSTGVDEKERFGIDVDECS